MTASAVDTQMLRQARFLRLIVFTVIYTYLIMYVLLPFCLYDQLQSWDTPGHLFAAWFTKIHTFPNYTGWNPFFYAGFPHNTFYPPLYHYLIATLSLIIGPIEWAFKLVNVLAVLALPLSFYYFVRKMQFQVAEASLMTLLMMLPIAAMNLRTGGTLYSLFYTGLGANALAMPLLFVYLGKLQDPVSRRHLLTSSVLFALILLSHFIVGLAAVLAAGMHLLLNMRKSLVLYYLQHGLLTFALTAFWLLPFLVYRAYYGGAFFETPLYAFFSVPVFALCLMGLLVVLKEKDLRFSSFILFFALMMGMMSFVDFKSYQIPLHPYRLTIYFLLLAMLLPVRLVFNQRSTHAKKALRASFVVLLVFYGYNITLGASESRRYEDNQNILYQHVAHNIAYKNLDMGPLKGRTIFFDGEKTPHIHDLRHLLARHSGNFFLKGLFVESSVNGEYAGSLHHNLFRDGFASLHYDMLKKLQTNDPEILQRNMNLFYIQNVLVKEPIRALTPVKRLDLSAQSMPYYLYESPSELVELLPYTPLTLKPGVNWTQAIYAWLLSKEQRVMVRAEQLPACVADAKSAVSALEQSPLQDQLRIQVQASCDVPVLIKISAFPRWQAYVNGQKTQIYHVAPHFMLVYGRGDIELTYRQTYVDYLGWIFSILGFFIVFYLYWQKPKRTDSIFSSGPV